MRTTHPAIIYIGQTGAGQVKLGRTTCLAERERAFRCVDPAYRTVYTGPADDRSELELLQLIRSYGFQAGRSREVFDVGLKLVTQIVTGKAPTGGKSQSDLLNAFLKAELEPGVTVEDACHPCLITLEGDDAPPPKLLMQHRLLLRAAGITYREPNKLEPGYVYLEAPDKFIQKFPELKHIVPFVVYSEGAWVLSGGVPVRATNLRPKPRAAH